VNLALLVVLGVAFPDSLAGALARIVQAVGLGG
jgi:hypothetical protein